MASRLYKDTVSLRCTLSQEARVILGPETGNAPPGSYRRVQIVVPDSPVVYLGIDMPVQEKFEDEGVGPNRNYVLPRLQPGQSTKVRLGPKQTLTASADAGLAFVTLLCEYIVEDGP